MKGVSKARTATTAPPEAVTCQGRVRGLVRNGVETYLGIPYGGDTSGSRRFLPPVRPDAWTGVRDATRPGDRAPQPVAPISPASDFVQYMAGGRAADVLALAEPMGEDCLLLNVLTPRADDRRRPVLVYMHGGGFSGGSGIVHTLGDRFVSEEEVVLVTLNHRLSALGYLYLGGLSERYSEGNPGLVDLVAALEWVRDNIGAFGGDPDKVTIFGESGGGAKVSYMLAMEKAHGLFHAAIIQSAGIVSPMASDEATELTLEVLHGLSIDPADLERLLEIPTEALDAAVSQVTQRRQRMGLRPVVDGVTVTTSPWDDGAPPVSADVPVIVGYCAGEATLFAGMQDPTLFAVDWPDVPRRLAERTNQPEAAFADAVAAYRATYPAASATDILFRMMSIQFLGWNGRMIADAKAKQPAPVYYYRMEYDTGIPPGLRAFHTCELPLANRMVSQPRAERLSTQIAGAWAAFARTGGDPNHPLLPRWDRYEPVRDGPIMLFDLECRAGADPEAAAQRILRRALGQPMQL